MDKKERIIKAMYEVFAEKGHSASMSDISKKVGIKPQSMYSHFESKDQIVWLALEKEIGSKFESLRIKLENLQNESCERALKEIAFYIYEYFNDYTRLKFWRNISVIQDKELRKKCREKIRSLEAENGKKMITIFQAGVKNGEIKNNNLEGMMKLYVAMIQGILDGMLLYNDSSVDMEDYAKKTWDAYWDGIKSVGGINDV